jgi:anti-sigma factor RsiW
MNCQEWEERIALYAAGDAAPEETAEIERHVAGCAGCQVFWSGMKQSLEWLREAHQEPIAPAHYAAVRARVMAELESGRARWWRRGWVYGVGLVAAVVVMALMMARSPAEGPRVAVVMPAEVGERVADAGQGASSGPGGPPHREVGRRKRLPHRQAETILVKLETDNPDVVIYWIAEKKGD